MSVTESPSLSRTERPAPARGGRTNRSARPPRRLRTRGEIRVWHLLVSAVVLALLALGSLFVGVSDITPTDLVTGDPDKVRVFLVSRVPRMAAILLAGMAMSVAGLIMQHLTRNRFVSPSTAGTVESAMLGVLVAIIFFGSQSVMAKMGIAVVFALAGTFVFLQLIRRTTFRDMIVVPLVGIMFGGVIQAVTTFFAYRMELLQSLDTWSNGDFSGILSGRYELLYLVLGALAIGYVFADRFTVAGMGEEFALNLGVSYTRVVNAGLAIIAVITAVVVVVVGAIPFLGLIVPNIVTMALGDNLRRVLPVTALGGAAFVLVCDVIGRTVRYPYEIPVGTVVSVVGSVVFIALILNSRRKAV
ncbi:iron chelate uptake ABC transporter family permease subunit [Thermobifida halotolerans]|uniref:Iron chelate uptake ABC transporter family permease subunit n=1 Tax=Thermobifida halotolerans TaxID=483545 RepID=A0AA97M180_9ACTN|nr:iron chelate uptake ABC transporter family permease subunit [Thermobifida halotolerans]UOE21714.1 iron chelate uptake ABC transporter family permease subunit [Thermobifida halotolerans]